MEIRTIDDLLNTDLISLLCKKINISIQEFDKNRLELDICFSSDSGLGYNLAYDEDEILFDDNKKMAFESYFNDLFISWKNPRSKKLYIALNSLDDEYIRFNEKFCETYELKCESGINYFDFK